MGISIKYIHRSLVLIFDPKGWGGWGSKIKNKSHLIFSSRFMLFPTFLNNFFLSHFVFSSRFMLFPTFVLLKKFRFFTKEKLISCFFSRFMLYPKLKKKS